MSLPHSWVTYWAPVRQLRVTSQSHSCWQPTVGGPSCQMQSLHADHALTLRCMCIKIMMLF